MLKYWLWLTTRTGLGVRGANLVAELFPSPEAIYFADEATYQAMGIRNYQPLLDKDLFIPEEILRRCYDRGISLLTMQDAAYPQRLRQLESAPCVLYGKGTLPQLDHLPVDWIISGPEQTLRLSGQPGEWLPFQVGVWALRQLPSVTVQWSALTGDRGIIEADRLTCINVEGVDCHGNAFSRAVEISADRVQPMWLIVDIPADAAGVYRGSVTVSAAGFEPRSIPIELTVSGEVLSDHGVSDS